MERSPGAVSYTHLDVYKRQPITREAYAILYEGRDPRQAMQMLMTREKRHEFEDAGWN